MRGYHAGEYIVLCGSHRALASTGQAQLADRGGRNFIETRTFSAEDDQRLLKAFDGLRVADVTDGMDFVGLHNVGLMDPEIHSLWKDPKKFGHRFVGIAVTVRYVPTQRPIAGGARATTNSARGKANGTTSSRRNRSSR